MLRFEARQRKGTDMYERKDRLYRRAKAEGMRSRAGFKLEDLDRGLIRPGGRVVDLGCWPGSWLQVAARRVGEGGRVVGVDLRQLAPIPLVQVRVVRGDIADDRVIDEVAAALDGPADSVLSDLAPSLSGVRERDEARSSDLVRRALAIAERLLRPGGNFVCKIFMNSDFAELREAIRRRFDEVSITRSEATRKGSAELYAVARRFKGVS